MLLKETGRTQIGLSRVNQSNIINLIGIKCAQCNLIYPQDLIEQHLITHIQPKYLMPFLQTSGAKKLKSTVNLTQETLSVKSADIPSLSGEMFPRQEQVRKDIKPPSEFGMIVHDLPPLKRDIVSYRGDKKDLYSMLEGGVEKEGVEMERLMHKVGLQKEETVLGQRQQISLYRSNRNGAGGMITDRIKTERKVNPFEESSTLSEKTKQYELLSVKEDEETIAGGKSFKPDRNVLVVNVHKYKDLTPRHEVISTTSAKKSYIPSTASRIDRSRVDRLEPTSLNNLDWTTQFDTSRSRFNHTHVSGNNLQCEECHGFYCQHCKSTIPPIYRPWNIEDIDPRVVQFYKEHVYKGKCEECDKGIK